MPMFESFYGFSATPFGRDISVDALYKDHERDELTDRLKYAAKRQLFAVLTGESGSGKTTLLRRFNNEASSSGYMIIYLYDSKLTSRHFYKGILEQLGFEAKYFRGDAKNQLHKEVEALKSNNRLSLVLIVDEAHLLSREMLEEVRFLLNLNMDSQSPLALILAGQSELWEKLRLPSYAAIRQRVDVLCQLSRLDLIKTKAYINAHLAFAGSGKEIFSDSAYEEIFKFSAGIPRLINKACLAALLFGSQNSKNIIDGNMLKFVADSELV
jgi:type II secretory pathway predicted ATPase ExeA